MYEHLDHYPAFLARSSELVDFRTKPFSNDHPIKYENKRKISGGEGSPSATQVMQWV